MRHSPTSGPNLDELMEHAAAREGLNLRQMRHETVTRGYIAAVLFYFSAFLLAKACERDPVPTPEPASETLYTIGTGMPLSRLLADAQPPPSWDTIGTCGYIFADETP